MPITNHVALGLVSRIRNRSGASSDRRSV
jgi:hypothetical protein